MFMMNYFTLSWIDSGDRIPRMILNAEKFGYFEGNLLRFIIFNVNVHYQETVNISV